MKGSYTRTDPPVVLPEEEGVHGGEERLLVHPVVPGHKIKSIIYKKNNTFLIKKKLVNVSFTHN